MPAPRPTRTGGRAISVTPYHTRHERAAAPADPTVPHRVNIIRQDEIDWDRHEELDPIGRSTRSYSTRKRCEINILKRAVAIIMTLLFLVSAAIPEKAMAQDTDQGGGARRIFLIDAPFVTWDDIGAASTPNLNSTLESAGIANLVARSNVRNEDETATPNETAASLASGWWMQEPSDVVTLPISESTAAMAANAQDEDGDDEEASASDAEAASDSTSAPVAADLAILPQIVEYAGGRTLPGRLAQALSDAGMQTAAVGASDYWENTVRPAAIAAADQDGLVDFCASDPNSILISDDSAPGGWRTDYAVLLDSIDYTAAQLAETGGLIAIDTGDLYRAGHHRLLLDDPDSQGIQEAWAEALSSFDEVVGHVLDLMDDDDVLIVYSTLAEATLADHSDESYSPLVIIGGGMDGLLHSPITGRDGIVTVLDLSDTIAELAGCSEIADNGGMLIPVDGSADSDVSTIVYELDIAASYGRAIDQSIDSVLYAFVALLGISFGLSLLMLSRSVRLPAKVLGILISATRLFWIVTMSFPLATYLMRPLAADGITPDDAIALCCAITLVLSMIAMFFGKLTKWLYSMLFLMGATTIVLIVDQLFGGILAQAGYLSYRPIDGIRFSGIGNEGAAVLFGSWLLLSGLLLNRYPDKRTSTIFGKWIFPMVSAAIIAVIVAPWWGANFGVLVWGVVGTGAAWWMFIGRRLNWRAVIFMVCFCGVLTLLLILADGMLGGGQSHLGATATNLTKMGLAYVPVILENMVTLSLATLFYDPILSIALVFIWIYLAWLRVSKPGPYTVFWDRNPFFKASFTSAMVVAVVMILIEDSGILLPALMLLYATAGLTWLICDLHRWELRAIKSDRGTTNELVDAPVGCFNKVG